MAMKFKTWTDFHHQINQIYHLFIAISLIPFSIVFLEIDSSRSFSIESGAVTYLIIFSVLALSGYISWYAWKGDRTKYQLIENMSIREKLEEFKRKNILRYVFLMIAGLLSLSGLWIVSSYLFVIAYFAILVQYSFLRPSMDRVTRDVRLTKEEREIFKGGEVK
jgi:hypothetical protein